MAALGLPYSSEERKHHESSEIFASLCSTLSPLDVVQELLSGHDCCLRALRKSVPIERRPSEMLATIVNASEDLNVEMAADLF
ncbi:hypothetical protein [Rhizobium sp. BR 362]|uniref:hypothetical protein n=1 Tax=Rhizobium sp. BR 362 TaxID=3040670 RepID=UPI002F3EB3DF